MSDLLSPSEEVDGLLHGTVDEIADIVLNFAVATAQGRDERAQRAFAAAEVSLANFAAFADLLGRRRMNLLWKEARRRAPPEERRGLAARAAWTFARPPLPSIPVVEFVEQTQDILRREPELAVGYEEVQHVYRERHGFALAKSMSIATTRRVQELIAAEVRGGRREPFNTAEAIAELGSWSRAYAETVYQTNLRTAYTAGQWARVAHPDVRNVLPAMMFRSALLKTSRPNHVACHGLIAPIDSQLWNHYSPPLGYCCHCAIDELSIYDLERRGLIGGDGLPLTVLPPGFGLVAKPDPGFGGGRPDRRVAGYAA